MSLASTRRTDELLSINTETCEFFIKVYEADGDPVRLDITANKNISIYRSGLLDKNGIESVNIRPK